MRQLFLLECALAIIFINFRSYSQSLPNYSNIPRRELNCFRSFDETNDGPSQMNVYLLSYLNTMIYPERLRRATGADYSSTNNMSFKDDFIRKFSPWFWNGTDNAQRPVITFKFLDINNSNQRQLMREGIDPEVALISTPDYIIVAWRGTDRVWNPQNDYYEWIGTDFRAPLINIPGDFVGKVHGYMWYSINAIKDQVDEFIFNNGGNSKHIWITGHSLGAGLAHIYTAYLKHKKGIPKNKLHCYMFSGPSFVGDAEFVADVHESIGKNKLQRFEYANDIVTLFPPGPATTANRFEALFGGSGCLAFCTYQKSGQRNYYRDASASGYSHNVAERFVDLPTSNSACEHNPNWIALAAFEQLTSDQKGRVPLPPPFTNLDACKPNGTVDYGLFPPPYNLPDGVYYIRSAAGNRKYLDVTWSDRFTNGTQLKLHNIGESPLNNKFKVERIPGPLGGYTIKCVLPEVTWLGTFPKERFIDADLLNTNKDGCRVQLWDRTLVGFTRTNQEWYIIQIANTNKYIIKCIKDGKVLDAVDDCVNSNGCRIQLWSEKASDKTQQWTFHKVD